ncbi:hypothetical protein [Stenotrophomonas sp. GD03657]|uniref:hypothetical protein n=1 Tax=Stenotrophomonas sp. GD03657 TaxID=2975363 RepID=UPI00244AD718|nr:hypothetical protein [Stenotrophomonas sp. GD03657]MDH2154340.1 hypothetical protein [Stenotrophomonas sp. GD03657]
MIVAVWDDERMPVDALGNRADIIMDADSTIKRMNVGRMYEQYNNATSRTVTDHVRGLFGILPMAADDDYKHGRMDEVEQKAYLENVQNIRKAQAGLAMGKYDAMAQTAWDYLMGYYEIVSPWMWEEMQKQEYTNPKQHVAAILESGVYLFFPSDNPVYYPDMVNEMREKYPTLIGPVTYHPSETSGPVKTLSNVLIGSLYIMLLEKTGGDHSGVSSAKTQHFGIPACLTKYDKYASPARSNPVRIAGESEVRLLAATIGGEMTAVLLDLSNSPASHKAVCDTILRSPTPTCIPEIVDRTKTPMGGNRALNLATHMLECAGVRFTVAPVDTLTPQIYRDITADDDVDEGLDVVAAKGGDEEEVEENTTKKAKGTAKAAVDEDEESDVDSDDDNDEPDED